MCYDFSMLYNGESLEELLNNYGGCEVSAMDVYSDIFDLGYGFIQCTGEQRNSKANPIILGSWNNKIKREIMLEDTFEEQLAHYQQADWAILNGLTYWGYANTGNSQAQLCAYIIDLDGITPQLFNNFLHAAYCDILDGHGFYPIPNYVILSGHNVHLYYLLEYPITLYPSVKNELKQLKYGLIRQVWNRYTSTIDKPQFQGINQGFRIIGGKTKIGTRVKAYCLNQHPFSIDELNQYVSEKSRASVTEDIDFFVDKNKLTLDEARKLYPEWYERVVVNHGAKKIWKVKEDLYHWWLRKLQDGSEVSFGHRYFCVMSLAIYAAKCGIIDKERVRADAMALIPIFNQINSDEPFTERDIDSALDCLDLRYCTFPRADIEKITAISIPANKRNGRKQEQHIKIMNAIRDIEHPDGTWRNKDGRPKGSKNKQQPKKDLVLSYKQEHPKATQREIAKALEISPTTVNKWLKSENLDLLEYLNAHCDYVDSDEQAEIEALNIDFDDLNGKELKYFEKPVLHMKYKKKKKAQKD